MRVLHRASGFTGTLVALDGDEIVLRGHTGLEKRYRNLPGTFAVDGTPTHLVPVRVTRPTTGRACADGRRTASGQPRGGGRARHGSPAAVGSGWKECTTPSWSRRCGVTTCASRGSSWNGSTAPTTSRTRCGRSVPGPASGSGVLLDHLVAGSKEARLAAAVRHPTCS